MAVKKFFSSQSAKRQKPPGSVTKVLRQRIDDKNARLLLAQNHEVNRFNDAEDCSGTTMKTAIKVMVDLTRFHRHMSASSTKLLECQRAQKVKMTVPADSIVETLNVIKHV